MADTYWLVLATDWAKSAPQDAAADLFRPVGLISVWPAAAGWCQVRDQELRLRRVASEAWLKAESLRQVGAWAEDEDAAFWLDPGILPVLSPAAPRTLAPPADSPESSVLGSLGPKLSEEVLVKLQQDGFVIVDNALPDTLCAMLRGEMDALLEKGQMWQSQSYSQDEGAAHHDIFETSLDFRQVRDTAPTFDRMETDQGLLQALRRIPALSELSMQHVRLQINLGNGGCYTMHTDSGVLAEEDSTQVLLATALFYLNDGWEEDHGGELRLYPFPLPPKRIAPRNGRLVLFHPRMVHEVLPNFRKRYCFTLWCAGAPVNSPTEDVDSMTTFAAAAAACEAGAALPNAAASAVPLPLRCLFLPELRPLLVYVFRDCELQSAVRSHVGPEREQMLEGIHWLELLPAAAADAAAEEISVGPKQLARLMAQHCHWWETPGPTSRQGSFDAGANDRMNADLMSPQAVAEATSLVLQQISEEAVTDGSCHSYACSDGWVPKANHGDVPGSSDTECCQRTCKLFTCGSGFVANVAYANNVGASSQQCCDKTCAGMQCPVGQHVAPKMLNVAGTTPEDCCAETCESVVCEPNYAKIAARKEEVHPPGQSQSFCCEATCGLHTCDAARSLAQDPKSLQLTEPSDAKCCKSTCGAFSCPAGSKVPASKERKVGSSPAECCDTLCGGYSCGKGYQADPLKAARFGNTDEVCCRRTCAIYQCNVGWAPKKNVENFVDVGDEICCQKKCVQYQEKCTGDFAPNPDANETIGDTADVCCSGTCALHSCGSGVLIPEPQVTVGAIDELCCEDALCADYRGKSLVDGCNALDKERWMSPVRWSCSTPAPTRQMCLPAPGEIWTFAR
ncbi:unnamed protein product [Effrenium voratum]|nr:unnamed protein product [Effrenium voratum]